jgi:hypothetical protein
MKYFQCYVVMAHVITGSVFNIENVLWEAWMVGVCVCVLPRVRVHVYVSVRVHVYVSVRVTLPC